jgi:hypothetical protein
MAIDAQWPFGPVSSAIFRFRPIVLFELLFIHQAIDGDLPSAGATITTMASSLFTIIIPLLYFVCIL